MFSELPMAPLQCGLDDAQLRRQIGRYRRLAASRRSLVRRERELVVGFTDELDEQLLQDTIAVERGCCPFFELVYEPGRRELTIAVAGQRHAPDLGAIESALAGSGAFPTAD